MIKCFRNNFSIICTKKGPSRIWCEYDIIEVVDGKVYRCYNLNHPKSNKFEWLHGYVCQDSEQLKSILGLNDRQPPEFEDYRGIEQQGSAMCRLEYNNEV